MNKVFLSIVIGIGIGVLIAPERGADTRRKLREVLEDWAEDDEPVQNEAYQSAEASLK